jgi:hypothetical protein
MFGGITYRSVLIESFGCCANFRINIQIFCTTLFEIWVSLRAELRFAIFMY